MFGFEYYIPAAAVLAGLKLLAAGYKCWKRQTSKKEGKKEKTMKDKNAIQNMSTKALLDELETRRLLSHHPQYI